MLVSLSGNISDVVTALKFLASTLVKEKVVREGEQVGIDLGWKVEWAEGREYSAEAWRCEIYGT